MKAKLSLALWGVVDVGVEFTPPNAWEVEMAAALRRMLGIRAKKVEVLIKGTRTDSLVPGRSACCRIHTAMTP